MHAVHAHLDYDVYEFTRQLYRFPDETLLRMNCVLISGTWPDEMPLNRPAAWRDVNTYNGETDDDPRSRRVKQRYQLVRDILNRFAERKLGYKAVTRFRLVEFRGEMNAEDFEAWWADHYGLRTAELLAQVDHNDEKHDLFPLFDRQLELIRDEDL